MKITFKEKSLSDSIDSNFILNFIIINVDFEIGKVPATLVYVLYHKKEIPINISHKLLTFEVEQSIVLFIFIKLNHSQG